ncbi:MAG: hypothetical protein VYC39_15155 [Myxococcota bacterium]|nr:hypothetical protein [Myxococcota bacterium]
MSKASPSFKDLGPLLLLVALMAVAYLAIRDRLNWNRDRINDLVGKHAMLENKVNELERRLTLKSSEPPPKKKLVLPNTKVGDISFISDGLDDSKVYGTVIEWVESIKPGYDKLKAKYKPESGRSIVIRMVFSQKGKVRNADYIKAPKNEKLSKELQKLLEKSKLSSGQKEELSLQVNFDP